MRFITTLLALLFLSLSACATQPDTVSAISDSTPAAGASAAETTPLSTPTLFATATTRPTLELPTLPADPPTVKTWTGQPTYLESLPGYSFHLEYDPVRWAETTNEMGMNVLAHRLIPYCTIAPTAGRGLPLGWIVEHTFKTIGPISFELSSVSQGGAAKYVDYHGGDGTIVTGFQVSFEGQMESCLEEAEAVLATLTSVPTP